MANIENIFRFISLRPTKLAKDTGRLNMYVYQQDYKSPFYDAVLTAAAAGATKGVLSGIATFKFATTLDKPEHSEDFSDVKAQIVRTVPAYQPQPAAEKGIREAYLNTVRIAEKHI